MIPKVGLVSLDLSLNKISSEIFKRLVTNVILNTYETLESIRLHDCSMDSIKTNAVSNAIKMAYEMSNLE